MLWLLQMIFAGHFHKWKTIEVENLEIWHHPSNEWAGRWILSGKRYTQQCEGCGKVVSRDLD